jgi:hypothetical protein
MWFSIDNLALVSAQAACVAAPAAGLPAWAQRFRGRAWALVLPLSIAAVVAAIELLPSAADALTWVALLLVPTGCGLALGWAARGARPRHAAPAILLLTIAWAAPHTRLAEISTTVLIAGSAVTLGRLLAGAAPLQLLKASLLAMAAVDAWLVFSGRLQAPNDVLIVAPPGSGSRSFSPRRSAPQAWDTATSSLPPSSAGSSPSAAHSSRRPSDWSSSHWVGTSSSSSTTFFQRRSRRPSCSSPRPSGDGARPRVAASLIPPRRSVRSVASPDHPIGSLSAPIGGGRHHPGSGSLGRCPARSRQRMLAS